MRGWLRVVIHGIGTVLVELLLGPDIFLGAERRVVAIEAVDELSSVDVPLVLLAAVPQVRVTVDDEDFFAVRGPVHAFLRRFVFLGSACMGVGPRPNLRSLQVGPWPNTGSLTC